MVIDMETVRSTCSRAAAPAAPVTPEEYVRRRVRDWLRDRCSLEIIAQAESRAERLVKAGMPVSRALQRATVWALNEQDKPTPPKAA